MESTLHDQARGLYDTIRLLQTRVTARLASRVAHSEGGVGGMDLTLAQMNALQAIRDHGPVSIKQLAETLRVSAPSASAMVDRLVDMGAVTREQSAVDRREVEIHITTDGAARVRHIEEEILRIIVQLLEKIGPECAQKWREVYDKLREVVSEGDPEPGNSLADVER